MRFIVLMVALALATAFIVSVSFAVGGADHNPVTTGTYEPLTVQENGTAVQSTQTANYKVQ